MADGSSWEGVIERLQADGYNVIAPQFPESSLADDVGRLRQVLARQDGPTIVAGHSYGGQIITALGNDAPNVVGMVYIAALGLDEGESLGALLAAGPPTPVTANLETDSQGFVWLPEQDFVSHLASHIEPAKAKVMYAVQQPIAGCPFQDVMGCRPGSPSRPGTWSPRATKRSRQTPSGSLPAGWERPLSRSPAITWPLCRTQTRWRG